MSRNSPVPQLQLIVGCQGDEVNFVASLPARTSGDARLAAAGQPLRTTPADTECGLPERDEIDRSIGHELCRWADDGGRHGVTGDDAVHVASTRSA